MRTATRFRTTITASSSSGAGRVDHEAVWRLGLVRLRGDRAEAENRRIVQAGHPAPFPSLVGDAPGENCDARIGQYLIQEEIAPAVVGIADDQLVHAGLKRGLGGRVDVGGQELAPLLCDVLARSLVPVPEVLAGENPARRKPKVSWGRYIRPGLVGP